ncbi:MAG: roadblock/LC7 domain-containing protein [Gemmatimonadota bacterium]|nr:roadblock/LC7 domain-containing protein [Gemmatimonadota bacterium]
MPTIRDFVRALRQRDGVDAVVVLGRDGLVIDSQTAPGIDADGMAALLPSVIAASEELGRHHAGGALASCVLEYERRIAIACVLSGEAILVVVAGPRADVGTLLFELRRNRGRIAAIV